MTHIETMKLALEALEKIHNHPKSFWNCMDEITALRQAIEQAEQAQPVAHCEAGPEHCPVCLAETHSLALAAAIGYVQRHTPKLVSDEICNALTAQPPRQPWVGLTDEERDDCKVISIEQTCLDIEAKLKEKNT